MDLGSATSPVGEEVVAVGSRVGGAGATLGQTSLELGPAFGDSFALSLSGREIAAFDALGAPFWHPAGSFARAASGPSRSTRLRELLNTTIRMPDGTLDGTLDGTPEDAMPILLFGDSPQPGGAVPVLRLTDSIGSTAERASHFGLADQSLVLTLPITAGLTATALTTEGVGNQDSLVGSSLVWRLPDTPLSFRAGTAGEPRTLLGAEADGAFGDLSADTTFAGVRADATHGVWHLVFNAEVGTVVPDARDGLLRGASDLATSAFSFHAVRPTRGGGAFRVSLSQPLRIESGHAELRLPVGRTKSGEVVRDAVALGLEPSGRQVDLELHWQRPLEHGELRLGAVLSHEPGHRRHEDPDLFLLAGWKVAF